MRNFRGAYACMQFATLLRQQLQMCGGSHPWPATQLVSHLLRDCNLLCSCLELLEWCAGAQHATLHPPLQQLAAGVCSHRMLAMPICLAGPILFIHRALVLLMVRQRWGNESCSNSALPIGLVETYALPCL